MFIKYFELLIWQKNEYFEGSAYINQVKLNNNEKLRSLNVTSSNILCQKSVSTKRNTDKAKDFSYRLENGNLYKNKQIIENH